ncbi:MAG: DUF4115 domain-containing protein [Candidatus Omnitrophica bacterium]|nr:DUF4115 domain-containing protein [Candidatus Omnitrophota bacterium]
MPDSLEKPKGFIFRQARETKGLSLRTVHEITKIPMDVLKGLEEGYEAGNISPFYLKAFKKKYAEFLGVDARQVEEEKRPKKVAPPITLKVTKINEDKYFPSPVEQFFNRRRQQQLVRFAGLAFALFLLIKAGGCVRGCFVGHPSKEKETKVAAKKIEKKSLPEKSKEVKVEKPSVTSAPAVVESPKKTEAVSSTSTEREKVHLTVKAEKRSWIQVKVDGDIVFQSVLEKGMAETWSGKKAIEISGKAIHNLAFELNGKGLGKLGRADRDARRVVFNEDGLSVKK